MTVLDLLDELEDIMDTASNVPLTGKVMVDKEEVMELVNDIRRSLPDDMKQAKWLKDEQNRILDDAKSEYKKLIVEAKKQADFLVDDNDITLKAKKRAERITQEAEDYSRELKMRTYDYLDRMLYDMQGKMDQLNNTYFVEMYNSLENTFNGIDSVLEKNRDELKQMASRTQNGEEWMYDSKSQDGDDDKE
ncbi:hypothetical protein [Eubacterium pyruvativorans]|uniref:hypothetical protein n=1 Tax=Eubacterium pyruvativorans TaxID=155865 RepID=UPI000884D355|nr:hypothetical protein [Eubacterium pyruvativorans]MDO5567947.1 hypothetical protein [Eubacteriales bacterium]MCI5747051.1 ATPase [Eubacterium pyruvativorans]MDD6707713.1 hypothetical protein [Eubacterium pyruvativorans]MDD7685498.1 hypothetical protein [Eubacterium pyruvativorans]MDY4050051.1 hypothetical protein [Eubacterium pyruvativorans]